LACFLSHGTIKSAEISRLFHQPNSPNILSKALLHKDYGNWPRQNLATIHVHDNKMASWQQAPNLQLEYDWQVAMLPNGIWQQ